MTTEKHYELWGDFVIFDSGNFRHYSKVGDPGDEEIVKYHEIRRNFFKQKDLGDFDSDLFNQMLQYQYNVGKIHLKVEDDQTILSVVSLILRLVSSNQEGFKDLISGFKYRGASNSIVDSSPNIIIYCKPENLDLIGRIIFKNAQQFFLQNYSKFEVPRYSEACEFRS